MRKRRAAVLTAGLAVSAVAGGLAVRTVLSRRRAGLEAGEDLSTLPPEDLGFVESFDGTKLAVRAAGDPANPILVFVHGFSLDMTTWHYQWTALSNRFRCILFDLRSHGRSEPAVSGDLSLSAMGRDVAAVVAATVGRRRGVVVGHSLGGMAVLAVGETHPELFGGRVRGVALIGTAASDLLRGVMGSVTELLRPRFGSLSHAVDRVNRLRRHVVTGRGDVGMLIARATQFGPHAPAYVVDHVVGLAARASSRVWTDGLAELMNVDLRHALGQVTVPTLVAVGDHDRVTPPAAAMILVGDLPAARLEIVEGAGHLPMLERPQAVNDMLARFTSEVLARRTTRKRRGPAA